MDINIIIDTSRLESDNMLAGRVTQCTFYNVYHYCVLCDVKRYLLLHARPAATCPARPTACDYRSAGFRAF